MSRLSQTGRRYDENGRPIKNPKLFSVNRKREHVGRTDSRNNQKAIYERKQDSKRLEEERRIQDKKYEEEYEYNNPEYEDSKYEVSNTELEDFDNTIKQENNKERKEDDIVLDSPDANDPLREIDQILGKDNDKGWIVWAVIAVIFFLIDFIF